MLLGLRSDLLAHPPALSSAAVRPSKLDQLQPLVTCPSTSAVPMFLASPPFFLLSYLLLPSACPCPASHCCPRAVPSCPVPLGLVSSVAVVRDKRYDKSEKKKREE